MDTPQPPTPDETLDALLRDPQVRAQVVEIVAEELKSRRPASWRSRLQPWIAGASGALVTLLAFFLPSLQDQWDRLQARQVIERHVALGHTFMDEGRYRLAEESFARAFELSENRRLDIEELRLEARVERVNADPTWGRPNPPGLRESDFIYLIHLRDGPGQAKARATAWNSYGMFLAGEGRPEEAEEALRSALRLDSTDATPWIGLGNVLGDRGRRAEAESAYRRAFTIDPISAAAHYDLALLLKDAGKALEATRELRRAVELDPTDSMALASLVDVLERTGHKAAADSFRARLAKLPRARPSPDVEPPAGAESP